MAYDFVRDPEAGKPVLLEISYVFVAEAIHDCLGHLRSDGNWQAGQIWPEELILHDLLK
jgi:hypothetical protein